MEREPNTQHVLSLSYGKDSIACLGAIEKLGLPLDRIVHAEVWATQDIPADLPPMVEFKSKADEWILQNYGIKVEHICAMKRYAERESESDGDNQSRISYEDMFYRSNCRGKFVGNIKGFPMQQKGWCKKLKYEGKADIRRYVLSGNQRENLRIPADTRDLVQQRSQTTVFSKVRLGRAADINIVQYLGIAADEPERIRRHTKPGYAMPLVEAGWTEADCRKWCEERGMLSPIYTAATRGGRWFCHNQGVEQLRLLRKTYPEYWEILLRWDSDSPVSFHPDGHTVHDFDRRFAAEDAGQINPNDRRFRWAVLDMPEQMRMI